MIHHPSIIIISLVFALIFLYKQEKFFTITAILIPIISAFSLYQLPDFNVVEICGINFIYEGSSYNKLIGSSFIIVMFSANLYSIGKKKKLELILGNSYGAMAMICLLSGDFISMLISLEMMLIFSTAIIFIGNKRDSFRSAQKYFITHLISSNMIMVGIAHIITKGDSIAITSVTDLMNNPEYSKNILLIMLFGMVINIAAFPFNGWMVNYYKHATASGFLYLLLFTTKVSVMLLVKTFAGYEPLKYAAILMIIYSSLKVIFENNIFSILCYLSINAMGMMLLGISVGTKEAILATVTYLFIHILYKSILNISCAAIVDYTGIILCTDLKKLRSKIILVALGTGIAMMVNMPITSSFYVKTELSNIFAESYIYLISIFLTVSTVFALPWKRYFFATQTCPIKLNIFTKLSIISISAVLIFIAIVGKELPVLDRVKSFASVKLLSIDSAKQIIIISAAIFAGLMSQVKRHDTNPINLFDWIGDAFFLVYNKWSNKNSKRGHSDSWMIDTLENQTIAKVESMHNQQMAIFIVFVVFIVSLMAMITYLAI